MSNYLIQSETLSGIANAIRGKTGGSTEIAVEDFATEISDIQTGHTTTIDGVEVDRDLDLSSDELTVLSVNVSDRSITDINYNQCIKYVNADASHLLLPAVSIGGSQSDKLYLNVKKSSATSWVDFLTSYLIESDIDADHFEGIFKANLYKVDDRYLFLIGYNNGDGNKMKLIDITNTSNPSVIYSTEESGDEMLCEVIELDNGGILILNNDGVIHTRDINYVNSNWSLGSDVNSGVNFDAESIECFSGACIGKDENSYYLIFCCDRPSNDERLIETFDFQPPNGLVELDVESLRYIEINGTRQKGTCPIYCGKDDDGNCYLIGHVYNRIKVILTSDYHISSASYVSNNANPAMTFIYGDYNNGYHDCGGYLSSSSRYFRKYPKMRSPLNESQTNESLKVTYYSEV